MQLSFIERPDPRKLDWQTQNAYYNSNKMLMGKPLSESRLSREQSGQYYSLRFYVLDNYDSFTYNLAHALQSKGAEVQVGLNDEVDIKQIAAWNPTGLILSPGPGRPEISGNMPRIVEQVAGRIPMLGVCLGLQMIAVYFGGQLRQARSIVHGKASQVFHDGSGVFRTLPTPLPAGRYHSLAVIEDTLPDDLIVSARSEDGEIMGLRHRSLPIEAVQFHPESILTPHGDSLLTNFMEMAAQFKPRPAAVENS